MSSLWRLTASTLIVTGVLVAPARPALALPGCDNVAPALNTLVTCTGGTTAVAIPAGGGMIEFTVIGAGGGGSKAVKQAGAGGLAAVVSGKVLLPGFSGTPQVTVRVGAGGAAGAGGSLGAGGGGAGSGIYVAPFGVASPIVVAGGGGGAGGSDIDGDQDGTGGNAGLAGKTGVAAVPGTAGQPAGSSLSPTANGGGGGSVGTYGPGGTGVVAGISGNMPISGATTPALGGVGAVIGTPRGGTGGGGYTGGGGGAAETIVNGAVYIGGGGGGGSSYVANPNVQDFATSLATSGAGVGGAGSLTTDVNPAEPGADGLVTLKFLPLTPQLTSVSPTSGSRKGGGVLTVNGSGLSGVTGVTVGGVACPVVTPGSIQLTCTIPRGTAAGPADVAVASPGGPATLPGSYTYLAASEITGVSPATGRLAGGQTLTISGLDLIGTTSVMVGAQQCTSFQTNSNVEVTCVTPAGNTAGVRDVALNGMNGPDTENNAFTYLPEPAITKVEPAGGRLSGGETITITGTDLTGTTAVTVGGAACTSVLVASATEVTCSTPPGTAGAKAVTLTSPGGSDTEATGFTYHPEPTIASVAPESGDPAGGETLTITGTALDSASAVTIDGQACTGVVAGPTTVTCVAPAAVHGPGPRDVQVTTLGGQKTLPGGYRYTGPPVIASVMPTAGPQDGGNAMTILGEDLGGVAEVRVGNQVCASMSPSASTVTCVVPSAATPGVVNVGVSASAGSDVKPNAYEYLPRPTTPPVPTTAPPTTPPTTTPTTTAPTPAPTTSAPPTSTPTTPPQVDLTLNIRAGAPVSGSTASVSGGGLRANSQYIVTMYSSPVRLAGGYADASGSFTAQFRLPARACVKGGLHRVVLSGFAPDGTVVTATNWLLFDDSCTTRSVSPAKPATVTYGTFRFNHSSSVLTPYVKSVLKRTHSTLNAAKRVTITGYTETGSRSEASRRANKALALKRARAARDHLRKLGVKAPITVVGAGAVNPLKGRPQSWNRRVFISAQY